MIFLSRPSSHGGTSDPEIFVLPDNYPIEDKATARLGARVCAGASPARACASPKPSSAIYPCGDCMMEFVCPDAWSSYACSVKKEREKNIFS